MSTNIHDKGVSIINTPRDLLKQYVQSQQSTSTADIMAAMKEMFRDVIQQVMEVEMEVEMDEELVRECCQHSATESPNYRNAEGMEDKILSLYACGMSQCDIAEQIKSLYDVDISPELVSKISEKIMPEVNVWQNRPTLPGAC